MKFLNFGVVIIALLLAIPSIAFTSKKQKSTKALDYFWFNYTGSGSLTDTANYVFDADQIPESCFGSTTVCTIKTLANLSAPHAINLPGFNSLSTASSGFTVAGIYGDRVVLERD